MVIAIVGGFVLLVLGFGAGYLIASQTATQSAVSTSPSSVVSENPTPSPSPSPLTPSPPPSVAGEGLPQDWSLCTNTVDKFSVGYPGTWFTFRPKQELTCAYFDPAPFTYSKDADLEHGGGPKAAMRANMGSSDLETHGQINTEPSDYNVLLKENTKVLGSKALRFETEYKQEGGFEEVGTRTYGFIIDRGGRAFFLMAKATPSKAKDFPGYKSVIDQAVKTVRFF